MPKLLSVTLAIGILLLTGCDRNEGTLPKVDQNQQQKAPSITGSSDNSAPTARDTYLAATRQEIEQLRSELDALTAKAKNSSIDVKARLEKQIQGFQDELKMIERKWEDIKNASATAWEGMQTSLSESIEKLRQAIHKASS